MTERAKGMGAGMGLGVGLGVLFWLLFDNIVFFPLWVSGGLMIGTALASRSSNAEEEVGRDDSNA